MNKLSLADIDRFSGHDFEKRLVSILQVQGYSNVKVTKASYDYGVDLTAKKNGLAYCFQAKRYSKPVSLAAVQQVYGAVDYYDADHGIVIANQPFTKSARKLADKLGIRLVDRRELRWWLETPVKKLERKIRPTKPQADALKALVKTRKERHAKALVVMATGLGKTYLAALDAKRFVGKKGRVLFIVHQKEILEQAEESFYKVFRDKATYGYYHGHRKDRKKRIIFATFQTLYKSKNKFKPDEFDYIIVDETHHAHARTYKPVVTYFKPKFMLGLTATPDRSDGLKASELYENNIPYEMGLIKALSKRYLAPVKYEIFNSNFGEININAGGFKYTITDLNRYLFIPQRDEEIAEKFYKKTSGVKNPKAIIFCPNIKYAERMKKHFADSAVVHNRIGTEERNARISQFREGKIKVILTVDLFNEGVDIPDANVIVFLRSTVSYIIFYQQLGRGLRKTVGKDKVLVLDFVANYDRVKILYNLRAKLADELERRRKTGTRVPKADYFWDDANFKFTQEKVHVFKILERIEAERAKRKPRDYWTEKTILQELGAVCKDLGQFPTAAYLKQIGKDTIIPRMYRYGDFYYFAKKLGYDVGKKPTGYWTEKKVISELKPICKKLGEFPSASYLKKIGKANLDSAIGASRGTYYFAKKLGCETAQKRKGNWNKKTTIKELRAICKKLKRFPTGADFRKIRRMDLENAVRKYGGSHHFAKKVGYKLKFKPAGYWTEKTVTRELKTISRRIGKFPNLSYLDKTNRNDLRAAITKYGGTYYFAKKLGYELSKKRKGYWTEKRILSELKAICRKIGRFPNQAYLTKIGKKPLHSQIIQKGGVHYFAKKLKYETNRKHKGYWTKKMVLKELKIICKKLGRFPMHPELKKLGKNALSNKILQLGGTTYFANKLGYKLQGRTWVQG